jgi:hypothetical protein
MTKQVMAVKPGSQISDVRRNSFIEECGGGSHESKEGQGGPQKDVKRPSPTILR